MRGIFLAHQRQRDMAFVHVMEAKLDNVLSWLAGLVWSGLVWSGLVWSGLVWSGLVWSGLLYSPLPYSGKATN
jgi:hypothetical protein